MDRIDSITAFIKVVEQGSFSAAARRLNLSTTMISKHIQALESRLGVRLLNRTTRKVGLTEIGRTYYQGCTRLVANFEEIENIARTLETTPSGILRFNCSPIIGALQISPIIAEFAELHPGLSVDMVLTERAVDLIEEGFDIAVRMEDKLPPNLVVRKLASVNWVVCGSPAYFKKHGTPQTPADLANHNCLTPDNSAYFDGWEFSDRAGKDHNVKISGNLSANNIVPLTVAALHGLGLTVVPDFILRDYVDDGRLVRVLHDYPMPERTIKALYPSNRHPSAKVRVFLEFLVKKFSMSDDRNRAAFPLFPTTRRPAKTIAR